MPCVRRSAPKQLTKLQDQQTPGRQCPKHRRPRAHHNPEHASKSQSYNRRKMQTPHANTTCTHTTHMPHTKQTPWQTPMCDSSETCTARWKRCWSLMDLGISCWKRCCTTVVGLSWEQPRLAWSLMDLGVVNRGACVVLDTTEACTARPAQSRAWPAQPSRQARSILLPGPLHPPARPVNPPARLLPSPLNPPAKPLDLSLVSASSQNAEPGKPHLTWPDDHWARPSLVMKSERCGTGQISLEVARPGGGPSSCNCIKLEVEPANLARPGEGFPLNASNEN